MDDPRRFDTKEDAELALLNDEIDGYAACPVCGTWWEDLEGFDEVDMCSDCGYDREDGNHDDD